MGWVRLDDAYYDHPKFTTLEPLAELLFIRALAWSNRNLTNGILPYGILARLTGDYGKGDGKPMANGMANALVLSGLWDALDDNRYQIHNYFEFQKSADEIKADRAAVIEKRQAAGRKGAMARWQTDGKANGKQDGKRNAIANGNDGKIDGTSIAKVWPQPQPLLLSTSKDLDSKFLPFEKEFNDAWKSYPRKKYRIPALKKYQARRREGATAEELQKATATYAVECQDTEAKYIMLGQTFYGPDERWKDFLVDESVDPDELPPKCPKCGFRTCVCAFNARNEQRKQNGV